MSIVIVPSNKVNYSEQGIWVFLNELREIANPKGKPAADAVWLDRLSWFELVRENLCDYTHFEVDLGKRPGDAMVSVVYREKTLFAIPVVNVLYQPNPTHTSSENGFAYAVGAVNTLLNEVVNEQSNAKWPNETVKFDPWSETIQLGPNDMPFGVSDIKAAFVSLQKRMNQEIPQEIWDDLAINKKPFFQATLRNSYLTLEISAAGPNSETWRLNLPMKILERAEYAKGRDEARSLVIAAWIRIIAVHYVKSKEAEIVSIRSQIDDARRLSEDSPITELVMQVCS